jgi:hypothetical protein
MISHILFNLFSKYNIGSFGFRKILAILITVLIFGLLYITVRFTGIDIPNYTRNLVMLVTVDLAGFLFLMWKRPKDLPKEEENEENVERTEEKVSEKVTEKVTEKVAEKVAEKVVEKVAEEEDESKIVIKKIEPVE